MSDSPQRVSENMRMFKVDVFRKTGASTLDIEMIDKLTELGKTAEEISPIVNVQIEVVRRFMKNPVVAPAPLPHQEETQSITEKLTKAITGKGKKDGTKHKRGFSR